MKILHILDHSVPLHSGYTFRTLSILRQQRAMGWETEHLTSAKQLINTKEVYKPVEDIDGLRFYRTPLETAWWHKISALDALSIISGLTKRLYEVVEEVKPDVLHAHSPALNGMAALRVSKAMKIPLLYECRAFWEDAAVNHGTCRAGSLRYHLTRSMESRVFRKADAITTICDGLRQDIIARGEPPEKITVIPNAVDIDKFQNSGEKSIELIERFNLKSNTVLGFFGSFYDYEGLSLLLDAMPEIIRQKPDITLLLVGGGPQEGLVQEKIQTLGIGGNVLLTGRVPHDQIQDYYQLVDIMVYPRLSMRLTDLVTPLKPLEAMAKGKLVVASDVGGHKELIKNKETGFLFKAGCPKALTETVMEVLSSRQLWPNIQICGRNFVENDRNWARSVSYYRGAYGRACGQ